MSVLMHFLFIWKYLEISTFKNTEKNISYYTNVMIREKVKCMQRKLTEFWLKFVKY